MVKKNPNGAKGKENVPKNGYKEEQSLRPEPVQSMVKDLSVLSMVPVSEDRVLPPEVKDIDEDDGDNPQLCSEYATETYVYLKQLEKNYIVRANHLPAGFPTNAKMRAQLIDWLVEVQVQFKLTQETFIRTVHTIDRYKKSLFICTTLVNCLDFQIHGSGGSQCSPQQATAGRCLSNVPDL